ncbi:MAG: winged helix-turn-helix transcriptional regulator [Solirubrobacteraceae bacterium]
MCRERDDLGRPILKLLAEESTIAILWQLAAGPGRPSELQRRLLQVPRTRLMRRLEHLARRGVVVRERIAGVLPRAEYGLTDPGRKLLEIVEAA